MLDCLMRAVAVAAVIVAANGFQDMSMRDYMLFNFASTTAAVLSCCYFALLLAGVWLSLTLPVIGASIVAFLCIASSEKIIQATSDRWSGCAKEIIR